MASKRTPQFWCNACRLPFQTDGAFKAHKATSRRHICCDVCGMDFKTEGGRRAHRAAHHAQEQDLTCKFCARNYPRVGSLIAHYEESKCKNISTDTFKQAIKDTMGHNKAMQAAHNFNDFRRAGDATGLTEEPLPPFRDAFTSLESYVPDSVLRERWANTGGKDDSDSGVTIEGAWPNPANQYGGFDNGGWENATGDYGMDTGGPLINFIPNNPIGANEDLISFKAKSAILKSPLSGVNAGSVQGVNQGATRGPPHTWTTANVTMGNANQGATRGPPHTWTAANVTMGNANQGATRGPPHTWTTANVTMDNANQGFVSPAPHVLPHLRGKTGATAGVNSQSSIKGGTSSTAAASPCENPATIPKPAEVSRPASDAWGNAGTGPPSANNGPSQNPWGKKNLFPDAPPAVTPPVELLSSLSIGAPAKVYREFDPADPNFKVSRFYVEFLRKWKCPYPSCKLSFKTSTQFVNHLNSPAHGDERFPCMTCYRIFNSATGLAQHAESQAVRCNVRNTDEFDFVVRGITADTTTTNGRLSDDTIRYEINPNAILDGSQMSRNLRLAREAKNYARDHYWDDKTPKW